MKICVDAWLDQSKFYSIHIGEIVALYSRNCFIEVIWYIYWSNDWFQENYSQWSALRASWWTHLCEFALDTCSYKYICSFHLILSYTYWGTESGLYGRLSHANCLLKKLCVFFYTMYNAKSNDWGMLSLHYLSTDMQDTSIHFLPHIEQKRFL